MAKQPGSIVSRLQQITIGPGGDIPIGGEEIITAKPVHEAKLEQVLGASPGGFAETEQQALDVLRRVVEEEARNLPGGFAQLDQPEMRERLTARVELILQPVQGSLELGAKVDVARIVDAYTSNLVEHAIEIPEIVVLPSRKDVTFGFKDFDLAGLDSLGVRPMDGKILIRNIRTGDFYDPIEVNAVSAKEPQLENYIVRCLVDHDEVDYDQHAALLFKLAHQVVEHLKSYMDGPQVEAVLRVHATMLADLVFAQMMEHYWETPTTYVPTVSKPHHPSFSPDRPERRQPADALKTRL